MKPASSNPLERLIFLREDGSRPWYAALLNFLLAGLLLSFVVYLSFYQLTTPDGWRKVSSYWPAFLSGWLVTIAIAAAALVLSTLIGVLLALGRRSRAMFLQDLSRMYTELIRGTPLLVQIYIFNYGILHLVGMQNRYMTGILILSGFSGAYIGEIIRAGIESVGKSQIDSARSIGLTNFQVHRYVIFPQTIRRILPPLAGQFASLIKDSSLLSIIGLNEFTQIASNVNSSTFMTLESYFPLAAGYLILTLPISLWTQSLERRHRFET